MLLIFVLGLALIATLCIHFYTVWHNPQRDLEIALRPMRIDDPEP